MKRRDFIAEAKMVAAALTQKWSTVRPIASVQRWKVLMVGALLLAQATMGDTAIDSVTITDPLGDTLIRKAPAYEDILEAQITEFLSSDGGTYFVLRQTLAAPVPLIPPLEPHPSGTKEILWAFGISSDETTFPIGYPFAGNGNFNPYEFMVWLVWNGSEFSGTVVDRRPLLEGEVPIFWEVDFAISGTEIVLFVAAVLLDNISEFQWRCGTVNVMGASFGADPDFASHLGNSGQVNGNSGFITVDHAGFPFTAFP